MKILYDHQMFSIQKYGGISRYFASLYLLLNQQQDVTADVSVLYSRNHYIKNKTFPLPTVLGESFLRKDRKLYRWNKKYSGYKIKNNDFDIFHPTYYDNYFLSDLKKPFVLTVHDMIYELFPEFFLPDEKYIQQKRQLIEKADHIIAISESTKKDVQEIFGIKEEKITVVYHGFYQSNAEETITFEPPFSSYILYVGDRTTYKNFNRFVRAIVPVLKGNAEINLICTGGGAFQTGELEILYRNGIMNRAIQISATDRQMKILYRNALVFVFPSLYEGFGFPLLEAFANDCPVVASDTSCFKEVGGQALLYFNPYDVLDMRQAIESVLLDPKLAARLVVNGCAQINEFSMEKCVDATVDVYKSVLGI